jgi:hypothetical protein
VSEVKHPLVDGFYWIRWAGGFTIAERTTITPSRIEWSPIGSEDYYVGDDKVAIVAGPLQPPEP